jgi:NADH-quinone oxidoreductase subunit K
MNLPVVEPWMVLSFCSIIFFIGLAGVLIRRNLLVIIMCIELMLNAVNLTLVTYSEILNDLGGEMTVFFVIVVAAVESAIGLSLVIALFRTMRSVDTESIETLRG